MSDPAPTSCATRYNNEVIMVHTAVTTRVRGSGSLALRTSPSVNRPRFRRGVTNNTNITAVLAMTVRGTPSGRSKVQPGGVYDQPAAKVSGARRDRTNRQRSTLARRAEVPGGCNTAPLLVSPSLGRCKVFATRAAE